MSRLADLARELDDQGRTEMAEAIREALNELRPGDLLTTGQAAEKLGVAITTVRRWVERGTLIGVDTGTRLLVSTESVERILRVRRNMLELDDEDWPADQELYALVRRIRRQMNAERLGDQERRAAG